MAFTDQWTESYPTGTTNANEIDTAISQGTKRALRERLGVDHNFVADESGVANIGAHNKCTLLVQGSDPSALADAGIIFTKDVSGKAELHWIDEDGNVIQITAAGKIKASNLDDYDHLVPTGFIGIWSGLISAIPTGYVICDGNNSTPNLLDKFLKGVLTAATNPGTTGGAATHTHSGPIHTHAYSGTTSSVTATSEADGLLKATGTHSHTYSGTTENNAAGDTGSASSLPPYYEVAYIKKS